MHFRKLRATRRIHIVVAGVVTIVETAESERDIGLSKISGVRIGG